MFGKIRIKGGKFQNGGVIFFINLKIFKYIISIVIMIMSIADCAPILMIIIMMMV